MGLLVFFSCKKEGDDPQSPPVDEVKKIALHTYTDGNGNSHSESYKYDEEGRILQWTRDDDRTIYTYSGLSITGKHYVKGVYSTTSTYTLNENGYVSHWILGTNPPHPGFDWAKEYDYIYDAEGHVIAETTTNWSGFSYISIFNYANGNLETSEYGSGGILTNEYDTSEKNSLANVNFGRKFHGVSSKNLIVSSRLTSAAGDLEETTNYQYEFDKDGNVIKNIETITTKHGFISTTTHNYTYQ